MFGRNHKKEALKYLKQAEEIWDNIRIDEINLADNIGELNHPSNKRLIISTNRLVDKIVDQLDAAKAEAVANLKEAKEQGYIGPKDDEKTPQNNFRNQCQTLISDISKGGIYSNARLRQVFTVRLKKLKNIVEDFPKV